MSGWLGRAGRVARCLAAAAGAAALLSPGAGAAQDRTQGLERTRLLGERFLLVRNANLIDGTGGLPRRDVGVLIRNGIIEFVGRVENMGAPEGTEVIDAGGGWLVPGFIDVYAHSADPVVLQALLAAGITTSRNPGSSMREGVDYRKASNSGDIRGPKIYTAGPVIDAPPGPWPGAALVETEEEARAAVRAQAEAGVDFVKLYVRLPPALVAAAVEEAHALGLPVVGELVATSWTAAARAGIDHLSHVVSRSPALLPLETRERYRRDVAEQLAHPNYRWLELLDLEGPEVDEMLGALLARDVSVDPTLAVIESVLFCGDSVYIASIAGYTRSLSAAAGSDPETRERCEAARWPEDFRERARQAWPKALRLVRLLHENGVRVAAGSAAPMGALPAGASFHRELALLAEAGIPNREVLRIGTANGAVALGILHQVGTIEPGKRADMVLLGNDPLADIRSTRDIEWVMMDAKLYTPAAPEETRSDGP